MIVLCAAIFVSFPTVVSSFAYMYTADAYLLAFLLATLAVYLTWCVKKWGTIAGMVCLAFAMGIYQAYATVAIVLVLLYIIRQFVIEKLDFLEAVRKDLKYLGMLVGGAVLYAVILKITLIRYNITLPGYQGIGALGIMSLGQYKAALQKTLYHFRLILGMEHGVEKHVYSLLNAAALLLIGLILIYLLVRNQVYKKKMSMLASIAAVCLIPVGAYFINFTSPDVQYYTLMEMAVCNVFISGIIGILLIAKRIFKNNLSSRMQYNLWFLLLGLLAVPFIPFRLIGFPQIFSWLGSLRSSPASGTATAMGEAVGIHPTGNTDWMNDFALSVNSETPSIAGYILLGIWTVGIFAMIILVIKSSLRLRNLEKSALPLQNPEKNIYFLRAIYSIARRSNCRFCGI